MVEYIFGFVSGVLAFFLAITLLYKNKEKD